MSTNSIEDLPKIVKTARDLALLGSYRNSLKEFKKAFQILEIRMNEISNDSYLLEKWKETKEKLKQECLLIISLYQNCKIFYEIKEEKRKFKDVFNFIL